MKALLIGYGEVGKGLYEVFSRNHEVTIHDPYLGIETRLPCPVVMMIAIPYSQGFVKIVKDYQAEFRPQATVIFSTVPIGTSRECGAVHSPIEGRHDNMARSIRHHFRWIGGESDIVKTFFLKAGLFVTEVPSPDITEFMKLQSLAMYAINIEWARYCKKVADHIGFDYKDLKDYNFDYNRLLQKNGMADFQRPVLDPPKGPIGGHCVLPGLALLDRQFPHPFTSVTIDINNAEKEIDK